MSYSKRNETDEKQEQQEETNKQTERKNEHFFPFIINANH